MDVDVSKVTKGQLLQAMTDYNFKLKRRYPNDYNPRPLGSFIMYLRGEQLSDDNKRHIIKVMEKEHYYFVAQREYEAIK